MNAIIKNTFKKYTKDMIVITILSLIKSLTSGIGVLILIPMLNIINISGSDMGVLSFAVTLFSNMPYATRVLVVLLAYVMIAVLAAVINRYFKLYSAQFVEKYTQNLRYEVYETVINSSWETFVHQEHDELLSSFVSEIRRVSKAIEIFPRIISTIFTFITHIVIAFALNVPLTFIVILVGSSFFFMMNGYFEDTKRNGERIRKANKQVLREIRMQLNGVKEIKSYGVEDFHAKKLAETLDEIRESNIGYIKLSSFPPMLFSLSSAILIAIIFYVSNIILKVEMIELVMIAYIFAKIWPIFNKMHTQILKINMLIPFFKNIYKVLENLKAGEKIEKKTKENIEFSKSIDFENVSFSYSSSNDMVLNKVSFSIKVNSTVAITGKSGAGKSTLADIIMGFLVPTKGRILVDDLVLNDDNIYAWRKSIGYMPQDPMILNNSIRENISYFNPKSTEEEIIEALNKSHAMDFVKNLPNGLDTMMGHKGCRLSGGEKQRIVLARVLVHNPSVLILDEATSALDHETEARIKETLDLLRNEITIVIIAHRQTTIDSANVILKVEDGNIFEII